MRFQPISTRAAYLRLAALVALALAATVAFAGTQDFTLVNQTGGEIYRVFISETANDDWEEDILGEDVMPDGDRLDVSFSGRSACLWDVVVMDDAENSVTWTGINLCEVSVVVLRCNDSECWAEYE
ncbi:MAG: argininosuccinate lyase [Acidobacteriota bacterium]